MKTTVTTIDLLRHGQSEGGDIFRGHTDVLLEEEGWQQMAAALQGVEGWQKIITSPLQRCQAFAQHLANQNGVELAVCDDLREVSFGDWDGRCFSEIAEQYSDLMAAFWQDPVKTTPPNAESLQDFCNRVRQAFWLEVNSEKGKHLLMVVHGGVIRAMLHDILKGDSTAFMRYEVPYACLSRIKIYHDDETDDCWPQLIFHNR